MGTPTDLLHDAEALRDEVARLGSISAVARTHRLNRSTVQSACKRHGVQSPLKQGQTSTQVGIRQEQRVGSEVTMDRATIVGDVRQIPTDTLTPEDLLRAHDLDPEDWVPDRMRVNRWDAQAGDGETVTLAQARLTARRILEVPEFRLPGVDGFVVPDAPERPPVRTSRTQPMAIVALHDGHAPFQDPLVEAHAARYLEDHADQLARVLYNGDAADNSPWGRHRRIPWKQISPTDASMGTHEHLRRLREPVPDDVPFDLTCGNHDHWTTQRLREQMPMLEGYTLPGDDVPVFNLRRSLGLDQLGITYADPRGGEYHDSMIWLADDLLAMHGTETSTGWVGGAVKEIQAWEGTAILQGHDHKLGMWMVGRRTRHGDVNQPAISGGTLAAREQGYDHKRRVAQGWVVFWIWPDGAWTPEFARHNPATGVTTCGRWRCDAAA